ncbi:MAG TPA: 1-deoxy-D-xylulose-5-phosphate reductoisomerase [Bacteroidales bacterium]|nr:1-deoxy-D-xylulose-5-phosphate reductoisomerase [Bacteroidales bacterium]
MKNRKRIAILGSTGSIGTQALNIIRDYPDFFEAQVLVANNNFELLINQAREFEPDAVVIADKSKYQRLKDSLSDLPVKVYAGNEAVEQIASMDSVDIVLTAMVGFSGLLPTIRAIEAGKIIALANKETLVVGGHLIYELLNKSKASIIPVDSEHSAIFQCLRGENPNSINKLILTASGGPFRGKNIQFLEKVSPEQALNHPNWKMGNKVTIDSASLMNKGLEVIEAHWLFGVPAEKIDVVIHPQSVIHSLVEFNDGSIKAQMGVPNMRIPIQYALDYPNRSFSNKNRFSFSDYSSFTFEKPDLRTFRNLKIAYDCLKKGGNAPCIMNAANEVAVELFLNKQISFTGISELIEETLTKTEHINIPNLKECLETDNISRKIAFELSKKIK